MHLQAFGLLMPRSCVVRGRAGRRHEVQRRHPHQGHQTWGICRSNEEGAQASAAAGILYL